MDWYAPSLRRASKAPVIGWASTSLDSDMSFVERGIPIPDAWPALQFPHAPKDEHHRPYNHKKRKNKRKKAPRGSKPLADLGTPLRSDQALPNSSTTQPPGTLTRI